MNPIKNIPQRDAFLKKMREKYNIIDPVLNEDLSSSRSPEPPEFNPANLNLDMYTGPWGKFEIAHLLRRTKFGVTVEDIHFFEELDMSAAVDLLLTETPEPNPPVNDYNDSETFDPDVPFGETWVNAERNNDLEGARIMSLKSWWIDNILNQGHSITEKMLLFWHNHLVTAWWDIFTAFTSYRYLRTLRKHHLGDFKALMRDITIDVSMLLYLNGAFNHKDAPDENYARELQELFCIGKGPNANFTEDDVRAAARVLTGWTVTWPVLNTAIYDPHRHDNDDKQFSEFYGNKKIEGKSGNAGSTELDELLDIIFDTEECALFICRKIYTFFVYPEISEEVESEIIIPLAELLRESNYVIKPVLDKLLKSNHFYDINVRGAIIKDPSNFLLGMWRTLKPPLPNEMDTHQYFELKNSMLWNMNNQGMQLGDPPSVAGWPAYYQIPIFDKSWITTNTITQRGLTTDSIVYWGFWSPSFQIPADLISFVTSLDNPEDPNALIDQFSLLFLGLEIDDNSKTILKRNNLLSGQEQDYYWTTAWQAYSNDPSNEINRNLVNFRLQLTMQNFLQLAEAHLL